MITVPLLLLVDFFTWWFIHAPLSLVRRGLILLRAVEHQLSFFYILKTFFKPWKGEYRDGLVTFAIFFGIFIKTFVLIADALILWLLLWVLILGIAAWVFWPVATILLLLGFF